MPTRRRTPSLRRRIAGAALLAAAPALATSPASGQTPLPAAPVRARAASAMPPSVITAPVAAVPQPLTLEESIRYALVNNPQLAGLRAQRGIAAAGVVLARTYPFNPLYQGSLAHAGNSLPGQVFNSGPTTNAITLDLQVMHQGRYRKQGAQATVSRTEWEIATSELTYAVAAARAFDGYIHRSAKLVITEEYLKLNQVALDQVKRLVDIGRSNPSDLILNRLEIGDIQAQIALNRLALNTARKDFYRALGATADVRPAGTLERPAPPADGERLLAAARAQRPERFARLAAVEEAEAEYRLQCADRFGNPQVGPSYDLNETRTNFIGVKFQVPIPAFNRKQGEIRLALEKKGQALAYARQIDVEIQQDVAAAVERLEYARASVDTYRSEQIPMLKQSLGDFEELFQKGQPGIDIFKIIDLRRRLLRAQDGYIDALREYTAAFADLALAVGDPALAVGGAAPEKKPAP